MDDALFPVPAEQQIEPPARKSPQERLKAQQLALIEHGMHPLSLVRAAGNVFLHPDAPRSGDKAAAGPRCGACAFWVRKHYHARDYAKCEWPDRPGRYPRVSHSAASDVPKWWPACRDFEPVAATSDG
jgi:hypothetical protein